jgi:hypothetical protein
MAALYRAVLWRMLWRMLWLGENSRKSKFVDFDIE